MRSMSKCLPVGAPSGLNRGTDWFWCQGARSKRLMARTGEGMRRISTGATWLILYRWTLIRAAKRMQKCSFATM